VDIVPHFFSGGKHVSCFNAIDVVSRYPTRQPFAHRRSEDAAAFLIHVWQEIGIPHYTQVDNEACFSGGARHKHVLGKVVRLAFEVGTELLFSPVNHPESNGSVERFHQDYDRHVWEDTYLDNMDDVLKQSQHFFKLYCQREDHRKLNEQSPKTIHSQHPVRKLVTDFNLSEMRRPLKERHVHFIRRVSAEGKFRVLNDEWVEPIPDTEKGVWVTIEFLTSGATLRIFGAAPAGPFSSSDGQRFAVARKTNKALPLPRYFGFGRGLTMVMWTSDQLSQYGIRVTPPRIRETTYTLDAILDNETVLDIKEHTTDTGGYTDMMFALFDLLGMQISPRLRDIGDYTLYPIDRSIKYKRIRSLLSQKPLKTSLFVDDWDESLRVAASMKMGWVTASTFISKLQAYPCRHKLTRMLVEYGRLIRSTFIPFFLDDQANRRRLLVQFNKGEEVHGLREFLFFDNKGKIRKQQPDDLVNLAGCLNLVSNAVVVWNTVYMQAAIDELRERGQVVNEADLVHLSPVRFKHINRYGSFVSM
jgi:TnpA family transposase